MDLDSSNEKNRFWDGMLISELIYGEGGEWFSMGIIKWTKKYLFEI